MNRYAKGKIYKIVSKDANIIDMYVGSTCSFTSRKSNHKKSTTNRVGRLYHLKLYKFMRDNGGWNNFDMIQIESYPCATKLDLLSRERYWYDQLKPSLNINIPGRTSKEWHSQPQQMNKSNNKSKKYYLNNKERVLKREKNRRSNKIICICGKNIGTQIYYSKHITTDLHKKRLRLNHEKTLRDFNRINNVLDLQDKLINDEFNKICNLIDAVK